MIFLADFQRRGEEKALGPFLGGRVAVEENLGVGRYDDRDFSLCLLDRLDFSCLGAEHLG